VWTGFRMDGRDLEWEVTGTAPRYLHIRSRDGRFAVRATILDDVFARDNGRIVLSLISTPVVVGAEFPLGRPAGEWPFQLGGDGFEVARYGLIHTELVRSLIGRWAHRRRHRSRGRARQAEPGAAPAGGGM
jgi:hypothetical protein